MMQSFLTFVSLRLARYTTCGEENRRKCPSDNKKITPFDGSKHSIHTSFVGATYQVARVLARSPWITALKRTNGTVLRQYRTSLLLPILIFASVVLAQDGQDTMPYIQSSAFNAPLLEGWENQSGDDFAQFHSAEDHATIRTALVEIGDPVAAAASDLRRAFGFDLEEPIYQDKVNLADGTWNVLLYEPDAVASASIMARRAGSQTVVISFVESDPEVRILMLTIAQNGGARADAATEIDLALSLLASNNAANQVETAALSLPSGEWTRVVGDSTVAMGMVFGNDSYIAIGEGETESLPKLADAYNRTVLGFFVTPDNSGYLALALTASFAILALLILSYFWRSRNIQKDLELIESLNQTDS